ncbi:lysozyme inhibitor [Sphingomonas sp. So64.6b]|uniref:MliC family protein n=1 Tax=Sphingomonas sp. So64.6b TaxID=2997354 RepID=UPI001601CD65|nr:MliC family protein [Sphingomonas sp. So64.6b]QNA83087.1 lysozyme inhibitor [Sphingomonas sp. So64.6b]
MRTVPLFALGALLLLAGCDQNDQVDQNNQVEANRSGSAVPLAGNQAAIPAMTGNAAGASHADSAAGSERFSCDNGASVIVTYGDDDVALLINGEEYALPGVEAASGSKYMSDTGMTKGRSLTWWSEGNAAMLIEAPIGDKSGARDLVLKCKLAADATSRPDID